MFAPWLVLEKKSLFSLISKTFRSKSWYKNVWRTTLRTAQLSLSCSKTSSLQRQLRMTTLSRFKQIGWRRKLLRLIEKEIDIIWWSSNQESCLFISRSLLRTFVLLRSLPESCSEGKILFMKGLSKKALISSLPSWDEFSLLTLKWMNWPLLIKIRGHP